MNQLPGEIVSRTFRFISNDRDEALGRQTIHNLRLCSHRMKSIATAFLIQKVMVGLSTQSFLEFEKLCSHPEFRLSIRHVRINVSMCDVQMAANQLRFTEHCASEFYQLLELYEFGGCGTGQSRDKVQKLWQVSDELRRMSGRDFNEMSATLHQRIILDFHKEYQRLTSDQEELRGKNSHLRRLCEALTQLPALETIQLDDRVITRDYIFDIISDDTIPFDDPRNLQFATRRLNWQGSFRTASLLQPPLEMLGELLGQIGRSKVRPRSIRIHLSIPTDLRGFQVTDEQACGIHELVSQAEDVQMHFDHWTRIGSNNNDRSVGEMSALGSLTQALTTTPTLDSLSLQLQDYPASRQSPVVSAHALLPLRQVKWPALNSLVLYHLPMDMDDLAFLVRSQCNTITSLVMQSPFLLTGDWDVAVEILAELKRLEHVEIRFPCGGRYARQFSSHENFPGSEVCGYILGRSNVNPIVAIAELPAP